MGNYSEALEQQVATLRWLCSSAASGWFERVRTIAKHNGDTYEWRKEYIASRMGLPLAEGDTFFLAHDILRLIWQSSSDVPSVTLSEDLLPSRQGFCLFEKTLDVGLGGVEIRGLTWAVLMRDGTEDQSGVGPCVFLTLWIHPHSTRQHLVPLGGESWDVGSDLTSEIEFSNSLPGGGEIGGRVLRFFAALLLFVNQRILVASPMRAERAARRRLEADGWVTEPVVRVVALRRSESNSTSPGRHESREWSCQWVVSGHWHPYWYGKEGEPKVRRPRWIMPYVKGPEDKPLKPPRAKVFAVVR